MDEKEIFDEIAGDAFEKAWNLYEAKKYPICSICRERHKSNDRHPCE